MVEAASEAAEAARLALRAIELGRDNALALTAAGAALAYIVRDLGAGASLIERALAINANLALTWF
jgi:hypothetical protein